MPLYEYQCRGCRKRIERMQDMGDEPLSVCPSCSGVLKRLISGCSISVEMQGKELYEREIGPEAKRIADKIRNGDEDATADILGEGAVGTFRPD